MGFAEAANLSGGQVDYEFSRIEKLDMDGGRTWPLLTVGGLILLAFAAMSIYLIHSSSRLQRSIEQQANWMISLDDARTRLTDAGVRGEAKTARELLFFDKDTIGMIFQVHTHIQNAADGDGVLLASLDHLHRTAFHLNALLSEDGGASNGLTSLRMELDGHLRMVAERIRNTAAHETVALGGKWYLLNGLAGLSIILAGLILFLVRTAVLRGRKLQLSLEWLRRIATTDELTGLWNRRAIFPILNRELSRCERDKDPISVLMVDFDNFKKINDSYGHKAGDAVLRDGAQRMLKILRPYDSVGRYGGEEIIILLPGCDAAEARQVAERLAEVVRATPFTYEEHRISATVSVGGATKRNPTPNHADRLVVSADQYLYEAKTTGRDRVVTGPSLSYNAEISETGA